MARDSGKSGGGSRTADLRRSIGRPVTDWRKVLRSRAMGWGLLSALAFVLLCASVASWTRSRPLVAAGRVMADTRTVRVPFDVIDEAKTAAKRERARVQTARIYNADMLVLRGIRESLEQLPPAIAEVTSFDQIDAKLRERFGLEPDWLAPISALVREGQVDPNWIETVERLSRRLRWSPLLDPQEHQRLLAADATMMNLRVEGEPEAMVARDSAMSIGSPTLADHIREIAGPGTNARGQRGAGFDGIYLQLVVNRLTRQPQPTYLFDELKTIEAKALAAGAVEPETIQYAADHVIYSRGQLLSEAALELDRQEMRAWRQQQGSWQRWLSLGGLAGAYAAIAIGLAGYTIGYSPKIRRNPARIGAIAGLLSGVMAIGCWGAVSDPSTIILTATAPSIFVAVIVAIAYDQRIALAYGMLHAVMMCVALQQSVTVFGVTAVGVGVAVWQLREIRDRNTIIRMGVVVASCLALVTTVMGLVEYPIMLRAIEQASRDALWAAAGGLLVGGVTLFILPSIERAFDITTGMTLIELRDPKQPLLRQLQQRAPGTYNHSLNVASLGESAADAIGADGLLTYVGALYHDIGKMNKPEYFVENQTPGINKHDKLSPAMSLLIIVGHVKDGMELAREFGLPRRLHHFIEAHHGTTLVEYFFHRARKQAEGSDGGDNGGAPAPEEIEYRYPGPKPRTKEVAILMLCDAVESAARSMSEPTPSRIEAMVRQIANKRLMDGQYDECDLTLHELATIVEAVSKSLAAIFHGRIAYPMRGKQEPAAAAPAEPASPVGSRSA